MCAAHRIVRQPHGSAVRKEITMSEQLNTLFNATESQEATANARSLAGTAQLTSVSTTIAHDILKAVNDNFEDYKELVAKSKVDHSAMDQLIAKAYDLSTVDVDFLKEIEEATIDGMLKSQQSKRSRSKSKVMTMDNYTSMMVGAIAENLIRLVTGKTKSASGNRRAAGKVDYTDAELETLANDQDKLRKEIRNVQSKKSIMKSKEGFSEEDERWQALLVAEEQLKSLRVDSVKVVAVDETKNALTDLLNGVDISHLKAADAKALLEKAMGLVSPQTTENDEEVTDNE